MIRLSVRELKTISYSLPEAEREGEQWHVPVSRDSVSFDTVPLENIPRLIFETVRWYGKYPYYNSRYRWVLITPVEIVV